MKCKCYGDKGFAKLLYCFSISNTRLEGLSSQLLVDVDSDKILAHQYIIAEIGKKRVNKRKEGYVHPEGYKDNLIWAYTRSYI